MRPRLGLQDSLVLYLIYISSNATSCLGTAHPRHCGGIERYLIVINMCTVQYCTQALPNSKECFERSMNRCCADIRFSTAHQMDGATSLGVDATLAVGFRLLLDLCWSLLSNLSAAERLVLMSRTALWLWRWLWRLCWLFGSGADSSSVSFPTTVRQHSAIGLLDHLQVPCFDV